MRELIVRQLVVSAGYRADAISRQASEELKRWAGGGRPPGDAHLRRKERAEDGHPDCLRCRLLWALGCMSGLEEDLESELGVERFAGTDRGVAEKGTKRGADGSTLPC